MAGCIQLKEFLYIEWSSIMKYFISSLHDFKFSTKGDREAVKTG